MNGKKWRAWPNVFCSDLVSHWVFPSNPELGIKKVLHVPNRNDMLILANDGGLYLSNGSETKYISISHKLKDICLGMTQTESEENYELLIVNENNFAYVVSLNEFEILRPVKATFLSNTLIQEAKFQSCVSGFAHLVLVDTFGGAWSSGARVQSGNFQRMDLDQEALNVNRIEFLQGYNVKCVTAGSDFTVALVVRNDERISPDDKSNSEIAPVKNSCPLGLPILENEYDDMTEADDKVQLRKKKFKQTKLEHEINDGETTKDDSDTLTEQGVERLAKSGIYINTNWQSYLSNQLSWIGIGVTNSGVNNTEDEDKELSNTKNNSFDNKIDDNEATKEKPTDAVADIDYDNNTADQQIDRNNSKSSSVTTRATSFVSDSMRAVGETVTVLSKSLSKSFSTEKQSDDQLFNDISTMSPDSSSIIPLSPMESTSMTSPLRIKGEKKLKNFSFNSTPKLAKKTLLVHRRSHSIDKISTVKGNNVIDNKMNNVNDSEDVFDTEVWAWGKGKRGQQGQGDMLDRLQPLQISTLSGIGVVKICSGDKHSLAITITGLIFGWGENSKGQACPHFSLAVCSVPQPVILPVGETATDICVIENISFVLSDVGNVYSFGTNEPNQSKSNTLTKVNLKDSQEMGEERAIKNIQSSKNALYGEVIEDFFLPLSNLKSLEKLFLHKMKDIYNLVIEPLYQQSTKISSDLEGLERLVKCTSICIKVVSQNVQASWDLAVLDSNVEKLPLFKNTNTFTEAMENYTKTVCDCLVVDSIRLEVGSKISSGVLDILRKNCHIQETTEENPTEMLHLLLIEPTNQLKHYISCLQSMIMAGSKTKSLSYINHSLAILKSSKKFIEREQKSMKKTREFWEMAGSRFSSLKRLTRRLVLESKDCLVTVSNSTSFSKHWIILMNDILVHAGYSSFVIHPLKTVWVESHQSLSTSTINKNDSKQDSKDLEINLVLPEDSLCLVASNSESKNEWLLQLQRYIISSLSANNILDPAKSHTTPPITRNTHFNFVKLSDLKNADYNGMWLYGKMHGQGKLTWPDGRSYQGQFRQNQKHGMGKMIVQDSHGKQTLYDGQWSCDKFEGRGKICYSNGDIYRGTVKDGKPHGHGLMKQGRFMGETNALVSGWKGFKLKHSRRKDPLLQAGSSSKGTGASVYNGEWSNGVKCGYGVLDDIIVGEKFMGMWNNDMKNGPGCVVTLDGVYYEGTFSHSKMVGKGLMMFEDETIYEGNFADAGVFSGAGTLKYANGDRLEGSFYGNYTDGMKFNGTVYKIVKTPNPGLLPHANPVQEFNFSPEKIGKHSVPSVQKWRSIYSLYYELFALPERNTKISCPNTSLIWEQLAIAINQNKNNVNLISSTQNLSISDDASSSNNKSNNSVTKSKSSVTLASIAADVLNTSYAAGDTAEYRDVLDGLEMIPNYYANELTIPYSQSVNSYLRKAFSSPFHPLSNLLMALCDCFTATYGGVRVHPRLLKHAVDELHAMVEGLYYFVQALFPTLPKYGQAAALPTDSADDCAKSEYVTAASILYPFILPKIHPSIFMLYALHYKKDDDEYWARILKWNRHPDLALLSFLGVDEKFWKLNVAGTTTNTGDAEITSNAYSADSFKDLRKSISVSRDLHFVRAVETLQQLKTTFTPYEKLDVLLETFKEINQIGQDTCGSSHCWSMDDLFPVFQYVVVRARILQLGAEIHMIDDLMESHLSTGEYGIMFTTLQASYYQIIRESISMY